MKKSFPLYLSIAASAAFIGQGIAGPAGSVHPPDVRPATTAKTSVKNATKVADVSAHHAAVQEGTSGGSSAEGSNNLPPPLRQQRVGNRHALRANVENTVVTRASSEHSTQVSEAALNAHNENVGSRMAARASTESTDRSNANKTARNDVYAAGYNPQAVGADRAAAKQAAGGAARSYAQGALSKAETTAATAQTEGVQQGDRTTFQNDRAAAKQAAGGAARSYAQGARNRAQTTAVNTGVNTANATATAKSDITAGLSTAQQNAQTTAQADRTIVQGDRTTVQTAQADRTTAQADRTALNEQARSQAREDVRANVITRNVAEQALRADAEGAARDAKIATSATRDAVKVGAAQGARTDRQRADAITGQATRNAGQAERTADQVQQTADQVQAKTEQ